MQLRFRVATGLVLTAAVAVSASEARVAVSSCFGKRATLTGTSRGDVLRGTPGGDVIVARGGADTILGQGGVDLICAGPGFDVVDGGPGSDRIDGGAGQGDRVTYETSARGVSVSLRTGRASGAGNDRLRGVEWVTGSRFADRLLGSDVANVVDGAGGDDVILFDGRGSDRYDGGPGRDLVSFALVDQEISADLGHGEVVKPTGIDGLSGIEDLEGGPRRNSLVGDDGPNRLIGGPEHDRLWGGAGDDVLLGGNEGDELIPGPGSDFVDGQEGLDVVSYYGDIGVNASLRAERAVDSTGVDVVLSLRTIIGSSGDDRLEGTDGEDSLIGLGGRDQLYGLGGNDYLQGGYVINAGKFTHLDGGPGFDDCRTGATYVDCERIEG